RLGLPGGDPGLLRRAAPLLVGALQRGRVRSPALHGGLGEPQHAGGGRALLLPARRCRRDAASGHVGDLPHRGRALLPALEPPNRLRGQKSETVAAETSNPWPFTVLVQRTLTGRTLQL